MGYQVCQWIAFFSAYIRTLVIVGLTYGCWKVVAEKEAGRRTKLFFVVLLAGLFVCDTFDVGAWWRYGAAAAALCGYGVGVCRVRWEKPAFLILLAYHLHVLSFLLADCMYQWADSLMLSRIDLNSPDFERKLYFCVALGQVSLMGVYALLARGLFLVFRRIGQGSWEMEWQDFIFLSVLNVVGILFAYMIVGMTVIKLETDVFLLFEEKRDVIWKIPLTGLLLLVGEYAGISVWKKYRLLLKERQLVLARGEQFKQMRERFEEADSFYRDVRSVRHDMNNHMATMRGLLGQGCYREAEEYLQKMGSSLDSFDARFSTGNTVCDVVINSKYRQARHQNIDMRVDFACAKECGIADYDMAIVLNNLLDNAMEACLPLQEGERYIKLELKCRGNFYLIEVENPYVGEVALDTETGLPKSTKKDKAYLSAGGTLQEGAKEAGGQKTAQEAECPLHGIGLRNVAAIAKLYYGTVTVETEHHIFAVTVLLQRQLGQKNAQ